MISNNQIRNLTLELFKQETSRDKQRKVGASQLSDPCTRHLAMAMLAEPEPPSKYWLGGKLGTAVHGLIEHNIDASSNAIFDGCLVERKITLGEIPGYGIISSKPDLLLASVNHLVDWKTTTRKKSKKLRDFLDGVKHDEESLYTIQKYLAQASLYAWGLNKLEDYSVDGISIVFINRDGTSDDDIWSHTVEYDESVALALWDRANALWSELQDGAHPMNYSGHEHCFKCSNKG